MTNRTARSSAAQIVVGESALSGAIQTGPQAFYGAVYKNCEFAREHTISTTALRWWMWPPGAPACGTVAARHTPGCVVVGGWLCLQVGTAVEQSWRTRSGPLWRLRIHTAARATAPSTQKKQQKTVVSCGRSSEQWTLEREPERESRSRSP